MDACIATCEGECPSNLVPQACRPFRSEMPKPMVFRACESGYNAGFEDAKNRVKEHMANQGSEEEAEEVAEPVAEAVEETKEEPQQVEEEEDQNSGKLRGQQSAE